MADISKCKGGNCPLKNTCYRYLASTNEYRQSWLTEIPYDKNKETCKYYWEYKHEDNMLYKKVGRKYKPVGYEFKGFPTDGIWLVDSKNGYSASCIIYLGEKMDKIPHKYSLIIKQFKKDIIDEYLKRIDEKYKTTGISEIDRIDILLDVILDFCENE